MTVAALVLGAGSGERLRASLTEAAGGGGVAGARTKALVRLRGRTLLARSVAALAAAPEIDHVVAVLPAEVIADACDPEAADPKLRAAVAGGAERQDSMARGLAALGPRVSLVAVHDAARPLVAPADVSAVVRAAREHGAAILATPSPDTIHLVQGGVVIGTPDRGECWAAQTPQVVRADWLREALEIARGRGVRATDEAGLMALLGVPVHVVAATAPNPKITRAADLAAAAALLAAAEADGDGRGAAGAADPARRA